MLHPEVCQGNTNIRDNYCQEYINILTWDNERTLVASNIVNTEDSAKTLRPQNTHCLIALKNQILVFKSLHFK